MNRIVTTIFLIGLLGLSACVTSPKQDDIANLIEYRGGNLKGVVDIKRYAVDTMPSGLQQASVMLFNRAQGVAQFEYKFVWFDPNNMPVDEDDRPWHAVTLQSRDQITVSGTSPTDRARKFQIQIRKPMGVNR
jgi:uncharacterized protein YcfL